MTGDHAPAVSLQRLRTMAGMTQVDLAEAAGWGQQRVSDIEHQAFESLTIRVLQRYVRALGFRLRVVVDVDGEESGLEWGPVCLFCPPH